MHSAKERGNQNYSVFIQYAGTLSTLSSALYALPPSARKIVILLQQPFLVFSYYSFPNVSPLPFITKLVKDFFP